VDGHDGRSTNGLVVAQATKRDFLPPDLGLLRRRTTCADTATGLAASSASGGT
jgi:hypothetical protein